MTKKRVSLMALFGDRKGFIEQAYVAVTMLGVTALYALASSHFLPEYSFNPYEFLATWSGLVCVWLARTTNILSWPWGIASSILFGIFFGQIGLPGQQWLNLGYFLLVQLWSWPHWAYGGKERTELPMGKLSWQGRVAALATLGAGATAAFYAIDLLAPGSFHPWLDATVAASSVVAQYLLGQKKVESWLIWLLPVNLGSIILFFMAGAYTSMALYVAFFIHAIFALKRWTEETRTMPATR
jgi:nicotinamide mononucleotide transporter